MTLCKAPPKRCRMKKLLLLIAISLLCATTFSVAGKIYKWTDSEGNVHYGAQPPNKQTKEITVRSKGSSSAPAPAAKVSNPKDATNKLLGALEKERKDKAEASAKAAKEKERNDKNCSSAKRRIAGLKLGGRQFVMTEAGERNYLDAAAIQKRLAEAQKAADKWCK